MAIQLALSTRQDISPQSYPERALSTIEDVKDEKEERLKKQENDGTGGEIAPLEEAQDMADLEEPGDMVYGVPEARAPKLLQEPHLPHPKEVAEHNVTHCPYRSWCNIYASKPQGEKTLTRKEPETWPEMT